MRQVTCSVQIIIKKFFLELSLKFIPLVMVKLIFLWLLLPSIGLNVCLLLWFLSPISNHRIPYFMGLSTTNLYSHVCAISMKSKEDGIKVRQRVSNELPRILRFLWPCGVCRRCFFGGLLYEIIYFVRKLI